jgi:transposase
MTSQDYVQILRTSLLPYTTEVVPLGEDIVFMQDNCPIHNAQNTRRFFEEHRHITVLPLPPNSPDLNPIENIWGLMVKEWQNANERSQEALEGHVREVWASLERRPGLFQNLIGSMRQRLQSVIDCDGGETKY